MSLFDHQPAFQVTVLTDRYCAIACLFVRAALGTHPMILSCEFGGCHHCFAKILARLEVGYPFPLDSHGSPRLGIPRGSGRPITQGEAPETTNLDPVSPHQRFEHGVEKDIHGHRRVPQRELGKALRQEKGEFGSRHCAGDFINECYLDKIIFARTGQPAVKVSLTAPLAAKQL